MKRYIITQPKEYGIYSLGDNIYTEIHIKDVLTSSPTDPSNVSISIICPHGISLVTSDAMNSSVTGIYTYDYSIPTDICYGIYRIQIETTGDHTFTNFNFVVFPWDVISRIREISGAFQQSDMSDAKLAVIAWDAYEETLAEVYELHYKEKPLPNPVNYEYVNGSNMDFKLKNIPIADINGDELITDIGMHGGDVAFTYRDIITKLKTIGKVVITNAIEGYVTLSTPSFTPLTIGCCDLSVTYCSQSENYNQNLMREAVALLAAHKALIAFKSLDKATLADLQSNRATESQRFLKRYEDLIEQIGFPMIGSGK
jgi:hypothetical protein